MQHLSQIPLFQKLEKLDHILISGAGGGFDIYSGIPLFLALRKMGKKVYLSNFSFTWLEESTAKEVPKYKNERMQTIEAGLNPSNAVKQEEVNQTRLIYALDGIEYVSPIIPKDKITIGFWLEKQGQIHLYIDKENPTYFYFDLEFLEEE